MKKYWKFIFIFLLVLICNIFASKLCGDEIWSYGFANNLYRGLVPYRDFNMVVTPFFPFFFSLIFHIFGSNIIVVIFFNALIVTICFYFIDKMVGDKLYIVLLFMLTPWVMIFACYNLFLFVFFVFIIYLEEKEKKNDYLIGLLLGLAILTKQNVGFFLLLPSLYYFKDLKCIKRRVFGFIVPILIFVSYLLLNDAFYQFLDLCFFGLFDFCDNSPNFNIFHILFLLMFIYTIYFMRKNKVGVKGYYVLAFYSIIIPLFDLYHFCLAFYSFLLLVLPNYKFKFINYKLFSLSIIIIVSLYNFYSNVDNSSFVYPNKINHFEYRFISKPYIELTYDLNDLIGENLERKVIFMDGNGYYFRIINDEDCSYLDLLNVGNWGYNGSEKLINEIKKHKDYIYLVDEKKISLDQQTDSNAIKFVMNNAKKIGKIFVYDIYFFE